jgi:transcription elongation GreA/GreB family factor
MDKKQLHQQVIELLRTTLAHAEQALRSAHESATHEENIAENKYDTLGLEASYLALGQARRVEEIRAALAAWSALPVADYDEERGVRLGALVELQNQHGKRQLLLLGPDGAGLQLAADGAEITLITPHSPLGQRLPGLVEGDCFELGAFRWELVTAW